MEPLVSDVADSKHGELGLALSEQDRLDLDPRFSGLFVRRRIPWQLLAAKVVDETARGEDVECAQCAFWTCSLRIVVVAVDGEDWDLDVEVWVVVVDGGEAVEKGSVSASFASSEVGVACERDSVPISLVTCLYSYPGVGDDLEANRSVPHAVLSEEGDRLVQRSSRRLVLVEEVSSQEEHIHLDAVQDKKGSVEGTVVVSCRYQRATVSTLRPTSCLLASSRISLKVSIESLPLTGSLSL